MSRYEILRKSSDNMGETNDCTVMAVAIATGCRYRKAHAAMATFGRKKGEGSWATAQAIRLLGMSVLPLAKRHALHKCKTLVTLERALPSRGIFLIQTSDHVLVARAGKIQDWTAGGRRHRIESIHRVSPRKRNRA